MKGVSNPTILADIYVLSNFNRCCTGPLNIVQSFGHKKVQPPFSNQKFFVSPKFHVCFLASSLQELRLTTLGV